MDVTTNLANHFVPKYIRSFLLDFNLKQALILRDRVVPGIIHT